MDASKTAVKAILVTLGAAFVLLSVIEWKKLADQIPSDDGKYAFGGTVNPDSPYQMVCTAKDLQSALPAGTVGPTLDQCEKLLGTNVPWTQGIKAFVYSWIGIGLLVAAFIKPKGAGVSGGGYW